MHVGEAPRRTRGEPRDRIEAELADIWQELLGIASPDPVENFFDVGGNSFLAIQLLARVEERLKAAIPVTVFFEDASIEALAIAIRDRVSPEYVPLVEIAGSAATGRPFFCVHAASGEVLYMRGLRQISYGRPIYAIRAVGLDGDARPLASIEAMATRYIDEIRCVQPHGPYLVGGFCLGGLIAHEMARQLIAAGESVSTVVLVDTVARDGRAPRDRDQLERLRARDIKNALGLAAPADSLPTMVAELRNAGWVAPDVGVTEFRKRLRVWTSNVAAAQRYRPSRIPVNLMIFYGRESGFSGDDLRRTWARLGGAAVAVTKISASHSKIFEDRRFAALLRRCLDESDR